MWSVLNSDTQFRIGEGQEMLVDWSNSEAVEERNVWTDYWLTFVGMCTGACGGQGQGRAGLNSGFILASLFGLR